MEKIEVIILAAGAAKRMEKNIPKQFLRIGGKPILIYVIEVLEKAGLFSKFILTTLPGYEDHYEDLIKTYNLKNIELVEGGETRQESCYFALKSVKSEKVLIHEAARPFITVEFINRIMGYDEVAVVPVLPIDFTVSVGDVYMTGMLQRDKLRNIQLPQLFNTEILRKAHEKAREDRFFATEDSTLIFQLGEKVRFVEGLIENFKITDQHDLFLAQQIKKAKDDIMT